MIGRGWWGGARYRATHALSSVSRRSSPDGIDEHREARVDGATDVAARINGECVLVGASCLGQLADALIGLAEMHEHWCGLPLIGVLARLLQERDGARVVLGGHGDARLDVQRVPPTRR